MEVNKTIQSVIRLRRLSKGISQEEVCLLVYDKSGIIINQSQFSYMENNKSKLNLTILFPIMDVLNLSFEEILPMLLKIDIKLEELPELIKYCASKNLKRWSFLFLNKFIFKNKRNNKQIILAIFQLVLHIKFTVYKLQNLYEYLKDLIQPIKGKNLFAIFEHIYLSCKREGKYTIASEIQKIFQDKISSLSSVQKTKVYHQYATILYYNKKYLQALPYSTKAVQKVNSLNLDSIISYSIYSRMGMILVQLEIFDVATENLEKAHKYMTEGKPFYIDSLVNLGYAYFKGGNFELAKETCEDLLVKRDLYDSQRLSILTIYTNMLLIEEKFNEAKEKLRMTNFLINSINLNRASINTELGIHLKNQYLYGRHTSYETDGEPFKILLEAFSLIKESPYQRELEEIKKYIFFELAKGSALLKEYNGYEALLDEIRK